MCSVFPVVAQTLLVIPHIRKVQYIFFLHYIPHGKRKDDLSNLGTNLTNTFPTPLFFVFLKKQRLKHSRAFFYVLSACQKFPPSVLSSLFFDVYQRHIQFQKKKNLYFLNSLSKGALAPLYVYFPPFFFYSEKISFLCVTSFFLLTIFFSSFFFFFRTAHSYC